MLWGYSSKLYPPGTPLLWRGWGRSFCERIHPPNIMKYNYKIFEEKAKKRAKKECFEYPCKFFVIK